MTILIGDGDVICYNACVPRWEHKVKYTPEGEQIRKIDKNGEYVPFTYSRKEDQEYMERSWEKLKRDLRILQDTLFCSESLIAVGKRENFRLSMYPDYKANRHKRAKPVPANHPKNFVPMLRELAVYEGLAVWATDREADDLLRIWAGECRKYGIEYIVASIDKDLKCIPGKYWNIKHKKLTKISEEYAMRFYYEQLLKGDPTDNIPGLPDIGDVTAKELLEDYNTEEEFQKVVVELYKVFYEDHWKDYLLSNGKMIHIQRTWDDYFNLEEWNV